MTSLELVDFINSIRGPKASQVRHDDFMRKVPLVLKELAPKFYGTNIYTNGKGGEQTRAIYIFPRKPALRMALSYSTDLQEAVLDAWEEAEKALKAKDVTPALPTTFAEALRLAATLEEEKQVAVLALEGAIAPIRLQGAYRH